MLHGKDTALAPGLCPDLGRWVLQGVQRKCGCPECDREAVSRRRRITRMRAIAGLRCLGAVQERLQQLRRLHLGLPVFVHFNGSVPDLNCPPTIHLA